MSEGTREPDELEAARHGAVRERRTMTRRPGLRYIRPETSNTQPDDDMKFDIEYCQQ